MFPMNKQTLKRTKCNQRIYIFNSRQNKRYIVRNDQNRYSQTKYRSSSFSCKEVTKFLKENKPDIFALPKDTNLPLGEQFPIRGSFTPKEMPRKLSS